MFPYQLEAQQVATLVLSIAGFGIWSLWAIKHRDTWGYAVPPLTWLFHVMLFYSTLLLFGDLQDIGFFKLWSSTLRLHAMFLIIGLGLVMLLERIVVRHE